MKKIVLSIIVALIAITANAQVYVGGTFGVGSDKVETEGTEVKNTTFKILPEIGYELNEDWSVGTVVGYEYNKSGDVKTNTFTIAPYARYFFLNSDVVRLFVNPEKPDVPLNKNDAFQKVQKRRVQEKR